MGAQNSEHTTTGELCALSGQIAWHVDYILIKQLKKQKKTQKASLKKFLKTEDILVGTEF